MITSSNSPVIFISQKDILDILNLFSVHGLAIEKYSSEISNYLYPIQIPKISKQQLNQVEERLHKQKDIAEPLSPIKDLFKYDSNKIIYFTQNFQSLAKNQPVSIIILMYFVISFLSTTNISSISDSFLYLLEAINLSKKILPRHYYIFAVSSCITRYTESNDSFLLSIAKQVFQNVQSDLFDLYTYLLVKSLRNCDQEPYEYLLNSLYDSILQNPKEFEECSFLNILSFLSQKVLALDPFALNLIDSLTYVRENDQDINNCLDSIPIYFQQHISSEFKICQFDVKPQQTDQFFRFSYDFEMKSYFTNGLIPLASEYFDRNFSIDIDIENVLNLMTNFLQNLENSYFDHFFNSISFPNDTIYLIFIKLLFIFHKRVKITKEIFNKILNPTVFTPTVSLFDYKEEYNNIFYLRKEVFNFIIKYHNHLIIPILVHFNSSPCLFTEFIGRLHCNLSLFDNLLLANDDLISSIVQIIMALKKDNSEPYQKARSTLDLFLFSIFKDEMFVRNKFFGSSIFVSGYFTSIFEPTLHSSIMNSYLNFLQNFNSSPEQLKPSIEMISSVITFSEDVDMAFSILHSFTEILSINHEIKSYIAPFIDSITAFLHLHPSQKFLNEAIQLYLHCEHQFEMRQIRHLSDSIHKINGDNDPDDQLVLNFLCLISNSPSASLHSRFSIFNEALLISFFSIFQTSQKAKPIFELFHELCKYSPFNCYKCNKAEVDLLFIEMIKNYPLKFNFRGCRMNSCIIESKRQIIDILCLILSVRSSIPVCLNMISLLKFSSPESDMINILLSHLVSIRKNTQPIGFCHSEVESFENGIRGKDIDAGFTLQLWIKIDESICHYSSSVVCILSIIDDHIKVNFKINSNSSLLAEVKGIDTVHTAILKHHFPSGVWNFITLAFKRPEKSKGYLYFSLNGDKYDRYTMKEMPHFSHNYATIKIGKIESMKPLKSVYPIFFGDYFFYSRKLKNIEIIEYYQKGEFHPDFVFRSKHPKKCIFPTFLDNFISNDVHQFILPYFYLNSDSNFALPNMFLETLINILNVCISYNEKVDIDFKVYAFALKRSDKITFALYQRFFSILDNSITLKTMKSLVYDILLNFEIWTRTKEPAHLYRITQHWGSSLFNSCSSVLTNFAIVFSQIPVYFSFIDPKNKSLDIDLCRQGIDKLLLSIASISFTNENTIAILSHCAASEDINQILYNFDLLYHICLIRDDISISICELLFYFLKPKKEKQFVACLKIIYAISKLKFPKFVDSILCLFNEFYITNELLELLLNIMPDFPMIYPLVIFIAINLKTNFDLSIITQSLQKLKIPFLAANWLLMPLILFSITKSVDIVLFCSSNMIDHFSIDAFEHSLTYIDFLSSIMNFNFDEFTLKFAKINVDFMNNENILEVQTMFSLCLRLLLISNQQTFSLSNFVNNNIDDVKYSIFNSKDFAANSSSVFKFNSSFDSYLELIQKNLSKQTFYFRISQSPLMMSAIRIFQVSKIDIPLFQKFYQFFVFITREKKKGKMKLSLLESLNSLFPYYYSNACDTIHENCICFQKKQVEYWTNAKNDSIKFMTSFGREEASIAISNTDFLKDNDSNKIIENNLRKNVLSQFSIWAHKKLYLTEIRRVFQYSNLFHQIRLKKSANLTQISTFYSSDQNSSNPSIKNLNPNSNLNSSSNSNSNASSNQDSDYSSTLSEPQNAASNISQANVVTNSNGSSENAFFKAKCLVVKINSEIQADFTLETDKFTVKTSTSQKVIMLYEISHIFKRNRFQIENSIEFIFVNGRSLFLDFSPLNSSAILTQFRNLRCDNLKTFEHSTPRKSFESSGLIEKWKNREISNFEYLMALNVYAGRSFKDSNMYPVFPWILTNYSLFENAFPSSYSTEFSPSSSPKQKSADDTKSDTQKKSKMSIPKLPNSTPFFRSIFQKTKMTEADQKVADTLSTDSDDNDDDNKDQKNDGDVKSTFYSNRSMNRSTSYIGDDSGFRSEKRNLSKPIAIQSEEKFHEFNMKFSIDHPISHSNCFFLVAPSNTAIIAHWLIRQPPFTQLHLKTESGKFGYPTRLFQSMSRAVYQAINGTISWELCPEFFSFPEIFVNMNRYNLGESVKSDVFSLHMSLEFIYVHRKVLESEEVSAYLNNWIDLIFGCKTRNLESGNVYSPILCDDVWKTCFSKYSKNFIVDTLKIAGQLPQSLFAEPHPKRNLLISPYSKSSTFSDQMYNEGKVRSISGVASLISNRSKYRQKLQSKIYILTDKVDVKELLLREKASILSHLSQNNESSENSNMQDLNDTIKIKHATFLRKVRASSDTAERSEEYLFLIEICDFVFGSLYVNFDSKSCRIELANDRFYKQKQRDPGIWPNGKEKDILYADFKYGFIAANTISNEIFIVRKSSITQFTFSKEIECNDSYNGYNDHDVVNEDESFEFDFLGCSGDEFCIGNSEGRFDVYFTNHIQAKPFSFNFLYERVSCFCLSQSYGVIVIGTVNGFIYIVDSKSGLISFRCSVLDKNVSFEKVDDRKSENDEFNNSCSFMSSSSLLESSSASSSYFRDGKIPKKIIVTEGFGFIVVYCDDLSLFVFNINGTLVRKRKLNFSAKILFAFKSNCGFDYIVAADSKGGIRFCEAFYLDFDENPIYICRSEILSISYDLSYDAILVITKNGGFFRIPTNTNQWIY